MPKLAKDRRSVLLIKLAGIADGLVGKSLGAPVKGVGEAAKTFLLGSKATKGAMKGKRLQPIKGMKGMKEIDQTEFQRLKYAKERGEQVAEAFTFKVNGKTVYAKQKYSPGGLAGTARRHPVMAAAGGYLAYKAATPEGRAMASALAPENTARKRAEEMVQINPYNAGRGAWG